MADAENFAGLLDELLSAAGASDDSGNDGGIFDGISPETLLLIMDIMGKLSESDMNTEFLTALRPLLREENRRKVDKAIMLTRLMNIIPLIRDSGLAENLFK